MDLTGGPEILVSICPKATKKPSIIEIEGFDEPPVGIEPTTY
jgi:hypothetical protein